MGILEKQVRLVGDRGETEVRALFDSGASYSIVSGEVADRIAEPRPLPMGEVWEFETARAGELIVPEHMIVLSAHFSDSEATFFDEFFVFDGITEELLIGATTMQKWGVRLDFENEVINYRKTAQRLRI